MSLIPPGTEAAYYAAPDGYTPEQERLIESGEWDPEEQSWADYRQDADDDERLRMADL